MNENEASPYEPNTLVLDISFPFEIVFTLMLSRVEGARRKAWPKPPLPSGDTGAHWDLPQSVERSTGDSDTGRAESRAPQCMRYVYAPQALTRECRLLPSRVPYSYRDASCSSFVSYPNSYPSTALSIFPRSRFHNSALSGSEVPMVRVESFPMTITPVLARVSATLSRRLSLRKPIS